MATRHQLKLGERLHEVEVEEHDGRFRVKLGDDWYPVELEQVGDGARYAVLIGNRPVDVFAEESPHGFHIVIGSRLFAVTVPQQRRGRPAAGPADVEVETDTGEWVLVSPMTGVIQEILVEPGDEVEAGQVVMVIEAMKMQNDLHARRAGTVKAVYVSVGQRVEQGTPLLVLL
jgi:biotin carboxyl carrier protein